jgi:hypothetical protein
MMSPQPGTGSNGRYYPYYSCGHAEKSSGTQCPFQYIPAEAADRAVLEFMKRLVLKPDLVETFARRANEFTSKTLGKLREDLERVRQQLAAVRTKIGHFLDAIGESGKTAMASVQDRLRALETEREDLEVSEARLRAEYQAETSQEIIVQDQVETLKTFDQLVQQNEDRPERLKSLLPRFIDYVVWRTKDKGEGDIEVALFPNAIALAPDVVFQEGPDAPRGGSKPEGIVSSEPQRWYPTNYTARFANLLGLKGDVRTVDLRKPYFFQWQDKALNLAWGERPALAGPRPPNARQRAALKNHLARVSPLDVARRYKAELARPGVRTKTQAAQRLEVSYIRMLQALSLLKLDPRIIEFLDAHYGDPIVAATFTEKGLRRLMATAPEGEQWTQFQATLEEARSKPSVYRTLARGGG